MTFNNQSDTNDSYTFERNGVLAIFLRSSSVLGGDVLGIAIWCSTFQVDGYVAELVIVLKMILAGMAS